jgi:signal transduction histidine kinase
MAFSRVRLRGLSIQLLTWIVLPTLLALAFVAYEGVMLHEQDMRNLVNERDNRAVHAAAAGLADRFTQRRLMLQGIVSRLSDDVSLSRLLADEPELQAVFDGGLVVTNSSGTVTDSWLPAENWLPPMPSTAGSWVVEHGNGPPLVIANARSHDEQLAVFGGISLTSLNVSATVGIVRDSPEIQFYLIADDGHLLESSSSAAVGTDLKDIAALNTNHLTTDSLITASSQVEVLNWTLFVQEPWSEVITPGLQLSLIAPLAVAPAIVLSVVILLFGLLVIVLPLRRLGLAAQRLSWGDFEAIHQPVGGVQEINDLQMAMNHMAQRIQQMQSSMHSYIGAVMRGQEDERLRLAHELHDDTLQSLIALDQKRQMVQRSLERDPTKTNDYLDQLRQMIDETINGLRQLIRNVRPSYLEDLGLTPTLEMLCSQASSPVMTVAFSGDTTPHRLTANQELALFRITQEAITNASHHAKAAKIQVVLHFANNEMSLTIQDNGKGFTVPERPDVFAQAGHYGLMGMVERAEQIGAKFRIDSKPGEGTRIEVRIVHLENASVH